MLSLVSMKRIWVLVRTEARIEFRERTALAGILLYVLSAAFIVFSIWRTLPPKEWGLAFWVIFLFSAMMASLRTFGAESEARYYYFYTLVHPAELFLAKATFNFVLLLSLFLVQWTVLSVMAGDPVLRKNWFFVVGLVAAGGFSVLLTFISSIAIKAPQRPALTGVLSLPLMIPMLMNLLRLTAYATGTTPDDNPWNELMLVSSVLALASAMGLWLFPYLWRS